MTPETIQAAIVIATLISPIATGVTEVIKKALNTPDRFAPLVSLIVGLGFGLLLIELSIFGALAGIMSGLAGTGLWEFGKTTIAGISTKNDAADAGMEPKL